MKGGTKLFKLNLGIQKGKNGYFWTQISICFLKNLPMAAEDPFLFGHILCMQYLHGSKKCFYSDIYINDNNFSNLARKTCHKFLSAKERNQFFMFGVGAKKGGTKIFPKS